MYSIRVHGRMVFFDRSIIRTNWKKINDRPLRRAGALVRKVARGSIRRVKRTAPPSKPDKPPRSRAPGAPFKLIYNLPYGPSAEIVGMVGFNLMGVPVPGLHEHGLARRTKVFVKGRRGIPGKKRRDKRVTKTIRYPKRPFMWPALIRTRSKLPGMWRGSLNNA